MITLNKLTEQFDDEIFQENSDVDEKFDFILPEKYLRKNLGVDYSIGVTPTGEQYDDIIVDGRSNDEEQLIDNYLNMNLIFDVGTKYKRRRTVVKRLRILDGRVIGYLNTNPFFGTSWYEIDFTNGTWNIYTVNLIAGNMYVQVYDEGRQFQLLADIQDHQK